MSLPAQASSVYIDGKAEALRHKWIESEKAARDLGPAAIAHWVNEHWLTYLRARWMEHIQGVRFWMEFDFRSYGALNRQFPNPLLVDRIVDRLRSGQENLDVIQWALSWHIPMEEVLNVLEAVDINSCRLSCHFADCA
jgi:hypothetical protein